MGSEVADLVARAAGLLARGGTLESTGGGDGPIKDADLTAALADTLRPGDGDNDLRNLTAKNALARARAAVAAIAGGDPPSRLSDLDISALELIVHTVGRPAVRYRNGRLGMPPNDLGDNSRWTVLVATQRASIETISSRVARIACEHGYAVPLLGTGWRAGIDFVITNRHVARLLVADASGALETWSIDPAKVPYVDFAYTDDTGGPQRCEISALEYCAPDLDLAVLRIFPGDSPIPPPIPIDRNSDTLGRTLQPGSTAPVFQGGEIYTVGHPYRADVTAPIASVFGQADGRKRWAPGLITRVLSDRPLLLHDSSTLSGSSGSCVIATGLENHAAIGLHFGGLEAPAAAGSGLGTSNYAIAFAQLGAHPALQYLAHRP